MGHKKHQCALRRCGCQDGAGFDLSFTSLEFYADASGDQRRFESCQRAALSGQLCQLMPLETEHAALARNASTVRPLVPGRLETFTPRVVIDLREIHRPALPTLHSPHEPCAIVTLLVRHFGCTLPKSSAPAAMLFKTDDATSRRRTQEDLRRTAGSCVRQGSVPLFQAA
jgi:hypothetical protein